MMGLDIGIERLCGRVVIGRNGWEKRVTGAGAVRRFVVSLSPPTSFDAPKFFLALSLPVPFPPVQIPPVLCPQSLQLDVNIPDRHPNCSRVPIPARFPAALFLGGDGDEEIAEQGKIPTK